MDKKNKIKLIFLLLFFFLLIFLFFQKNRIDADIFSLIDTQESMGEIQKSISNEIVFLTNSKKHANNINKILIDSQIFENINFDFTKKLKNITEDLRELKLATLNRNVVNLLKKDKNTFFQNNIKDFFNPFATRVLPINNDFFNLASQSNLIENNTNLYFDFDDNHIKAQDENQTYIFIKASLIKIYDSNKLLQTIKLITKDAQDNNAIIKIAGGAIYSALGKKSGNIESIYMSVSSLILISILLLIIFQKKEILYLGFIAIFGLIFGLSGAFLFFEKVHILSIVLSTSLIGLMFDFAIHWLSLSTDFPLKKGSIRPMLKIFIIGLMVTISGYIIFIFAPLSVLKEYAIFSVFGLIGAFLSTYFLLPTLLEEKNIEISPRAKSLIIKYESFVLRASSFLFRKKIFIIGGLLLCIFSIFFINLKDDIKTYSSIPQTWLNDANDIKKITNTSLETKFIVLKSNDIINDELKIIKLLKELELIGDYEGISKIILSKDEQEDLRSLFKEFANDDVVLSIYEKAGFDKKFIKNELIKLSNTKILELGDLILKESLKDFDRFLINKNKSLIYLKEPINYQEISRIAQENSGVYIDYVKSLNDKFENIKIIAVELKIIAYIFAFLILMKFFGLKKASIMMFIVLLSMFLTLSIFAIFGYAVNVFVIFGLILASAVGIDYVIFALNESLKSYQRIFGIFLASLTSIISFLFLSTSATNAISSLGLSVSICIGFSSLFACMLSLKNRF